MLMNYIYIYICRRWSASGMKCCVFQYERFPSFGRHYYLIFIIVPTNARTHVRTHTHTYTYAHTHTVKTNCKIHPRTGREGPEGVEV